MTYIEYSAEVASSQDYLW